MSRLSAWWKRITAPEPSPPIAPSPEAPVAPAVPVQAFPVGISMTDQERITHALYRLDAMGRHVEQSAREISERKMTEFMNEARILCAHLMASGAMLEHQAEAAIKRIRGR